MSVNLSPEIKRQLVRILKQISQGCELEALAVINSEGLKVAFFAEKGTDPDLLAAVSSAITSTGRMVTSQLEHGKLEQMLVRGKEGFTILSDVGDYILIGASHDLHNVGLAIQVIKRYTADVREILVKSLG